MPQKCLHSLKSVKGSTFWHFLFTEHSAETAMVNGDGAHDHAEEAEPKQDGNGEADAGDDSNEQEVIVIQDTGFTVKIQAPGTEPFDLQVRKTFDKS